jgi:hypothetical protein
MYRSYAGVYGPGKPNSRLPTDAWPCPHSFNGWLRRETQYRTADRSTGVLWIMSGAHFLRAVAQLNSVDDYVKGHYEWGFSGKRACRVD